MCMTSAHSRCCGRARARTAETVASPNSPPTATGPPLQESTPYTVCAAHPTAAAHTAHRSDRTWTCTSSRATARCRTQANLANHFTHTSRHTALPFKKTFFHIRASVYYTPGSRFSAAVARAVPPKGGLLGRARLGRVVHIEEAEALGVAVVPLEVVEQAPAKVATHRHAVLDQREPNLLRVVGEVLLLLRVVRGGGGAHAVAAPPILGDEHIAVPPRAAAPCRPVEQ
eukprot:scaffold86386_cov75-Phaeocystis_antarctica.AAC.6